MFQIVRLLLPSILITVCFATLFASGLAQLEVLPADEVQALSAIFNTLGKKNWDSSINPCNDSVLNFDDVEDQTSPLVHVNCRNCVVNGNESYRVVGIFLKEQSVSGTLPSNLVKLRCLEDFDLGRNYLHGPIPPEWGSMQRLVNISLFGNRITGSIPGALANIKTLRSLIVDINQLSGNLPPELGNMSSLKTLSLSSNSFTGELPSSFANLSSLQNFRISDNLFSGQIPSYIQNWKNLTILYIQSSGLRGPIPSLDPLKNLSDLRISDVNGSSVTFPVPIINVPQWETLILRNCNLTGPLPDKIFLPPGGDTEFNVLDLSFNRLSGEIPSGFQNLTTVDHIYLSGNLFTGPIPNWMLNGSGKMIDLSFNSFTIKKSELPSTCPNGTVLTNRMINLFKSSNSTGNEAVVRCSESLPSCPQYSTRVQINCGGHKEIIKGSTFDADIDPGGPSNFFVAPEYWSFSSTGKFMIDNESEYILSIDSSELSKDTINPELYMTARISPLSLTYYAFCLVSGNYRVRLYFAEIVYTDDETYTSLGRRVFDVYIQGKPVLMDFDIVKAAGGVRKPTIQSFDAVVVTNSTLEIRFCWAGKGTTDIPYRSGNYGPLISAISVDTGDETGISVGAVVGTIVGGAFVIILFVVAILWWKGRLGQRSSATENDLRDLDLKTGTFNFRQIKIATNNFDAANKIGEGGFGSVYKGLLSDGTMIAVKQLSSKSKQGNREFLNEIGMISALQHPHLVKLYGCCVERNQLLLVYEYMENNSVARALFGPEESQLQLDWPIRHRICVGIARGLAYLHEESRLKIVHRDIKSSNVLLDKNLNPKISDFGMAKLDEEDNTHMSTRIIGTYGYMAPEYAMHGYLTEKADVYSFGIVVLEIVSGKTNTSHRPKGESLQLLDWALVLKEKGNLLDLADPKLGSNYRKEEVMRMINVALLCTNFSAAVRPTMSSVVSMLEGDAVIPELSPNLSIVDNEMKLKALWDHFQDKKESSREHSQTQSILRDDQFTGTSSTSAVDQFTGTSSTSTVDLYPINMDSS